MNFNRGDSKEVNLRKFPDTGILKKKAENFKMRPQDLKELGGGAAYAPGICMSSTW